MDLDTGHTGKTQPERRQRSRRTGRKPTTDEGRMHPVADLERVLADPSHEACSADDTGPFEHPIAVLGALGPIAVPAFQQLLALLQRRRLQRDPWHPGAKMFQALAYRHRQSRCIVSLVAAQYEALEDDLSGRSGARSLHDLHNMVGARSDLLRRDPRGVRGKADCQDSRLSQRSALTMPGGMSMPDETVGTQGWDPDQYSKFAAERAKPFVDLLAMVEPVPGGDVIDLGCGTGELTARLHAHTKAATTIGVDASEAMLAKAHPLAGNGLRFELGDIGRFGAERSFDVVFANASLHWVPDHPRLVGQLAAGLRPGGQLAVQVPANTDHPSHAVAFEVATEAPFLEHVGADPLADAHAVCTPEQYAELLDGIGFSDQHVRLQVYGHHLASTAAVAEWTKGTTLLRFKSLLPPDLFDPFVERYRRRLAEVLGEQAPYFYTFKRILFWARLPGPRSSGE